MEPVYQPTLNNYPLSGPVSQFFDIMNSWFRSVSGQFGFINIIIGKTAKPQTERKILENVGTYGKQLGRIGDALRILIEKEDMSKLKPEQKSAVVAFLAQVNEIDSIK